MTAVNGISSSTGTLAPPTTLPGQQLDQNDFLQLMIEQFRAQDPTNPTDPSQMVGQLAQFSQIAATQQMQTSLDQLSTTLQGDQAVNASSLIGRQVLVPATTASLLPGQTGGIQGAIGVPGAMDDVQVVISDATGKTVRTLDLGGQPAGLATFAWDGLDATGQPAAPGTYTFTSGSPTSQFSTYVAGPVTGVSNTGGAADLQVGGVGDVSFNQVAQIF